MKAYIELHLKQMGIEKPTFKVSKRYESLTSTDETHVKAITKTGQYSACYSKIRKESRLISDTKSPDLIFKLGIKTMHKSTDK